MSSAKIKLLVYSFNVDHCKIHISYKIDFLPQLQLISQSDWLICHKFVDKSRYHAARVNVSHNAFFSSRSEKIFGIDIVVKNKSKCGLSWSVLLLIMSSSLSQTFVVDSLGCAL